MSRSLFVCALALLVAIVAAEKKCGKCELDLCAKPPKGCPAGVIKDACGCCDVCGQAEGEECDHPEVPSNVFIGTCGHGLQCQLRDDIEEDMPKEAYCVCSKQESLCGADGVTYDNMCQLMEAVVAAGRKIGIKKKGPCDVAPKIFTPPEHAINKTGSNIALACEAVAFPIPTIEWTWTKAGGKPDFLPSDDDHISVNMRGGPDKYQVTGWLQIQEVQKYHEGDYTCVATNDHGTAQATARVKVMV